METSLLTDTVVQNKFIVCVVVSEMFNKHLEISKKQAFAKYDKLTHHGDELTRHGDELT